MERPLTTAAPEVFNVTFRVLTLDQYATFKTWYETDLRFGVNRFIFRDPLVRRPVWFKMLGGDPPFQVSASGGKYVNLQARLMRLPGVPWFSDYIPSGVCRVPYFVADYAEGVYGIDGQTVAASALPTIAGTYWVQRTTTTSITEAQETLVATDIPATAPAGTTKILGFEI
ncbi:hypothetical protein XM52_13745 [Roseovarius indicus]|nr:hypothetical protein XM52_13745 [Roseovarius indicus]